MKKLFGILFILAMSITQIEAFTWDACITKYSKAKQFSHSTRLAYLYLKSTQSCLIKFKEILKQAPNPEFTVEAMNDNIVMLEKAINTLLPNYVTYNIIEEIPKYLNINSAKPIKNIEYEYF